MHLRCICCAAHREIHCRFPRTRTWLHVLLAKNLRAVSGIWLGRRWWLLRIANPLGKYIWIFFVFIQTRIYSNCSWTLCFRSFYVMNKSTLVIQRSWFSETTKKNTQTINKLINRRKKIGNSGMKVCMWFCQEDSHFWVGFYLLDKHEFKKRE